MRRRRHAAVLLSLPLLAAATAHGAAAPSPDARLERLATSGATPRAMTAERVLRRMEVAALGPRHAAEHAQVRRVVRRGRARDLRRARLGLPPLRPRRPARALAVGDPSQVGRWSAPAAVPVVGVHASVLPTGKILLIQNRSGAGVGYLLDPVTGTGRRVDPPNNLFCSGQTFLADGRYVAVGGQLRSNADFTNFWGLNHITVFDPWTETWTRQVDMRHGRWYPTATRLPDGRVLITSGWDENGTGTMNPDVEVWTPGEGGGSLSVIASRTTNFYPHWFVMPDGRALLAGGGRLDTALLDPATGGLTETPRLNESRTGYGSGVLLPGGPSGSTRVMLVGGAATATTELFDAANASAGYAYGPRLPQARRNVNTVLLPDGAMVVVGGNSVGNEAQPQREALMWTPGDTAFTPVAAQSEQRAYHSTALLLPDGRVWSGGDNTGTGGGGNGDLYEIFEPPYLFRGPRPTIAAAPGTLAYGERFEIATGGGATRAVLIAPGAATHGNDMNQRHIELAVTPTADGLAAVAPPSANVAPPGYHMLFVLNAAGVPSVASWVRVGGATPPPPPPPPPPTGNRPPLASFTASPSNPEPGQEVTLTDTSTDPDGTVASRAWDLDDDGEFDDGTGATATVTFAAAGSYPIRLRVTDDDGATATTLSAVDVGAAPPPPPANTPPAASFTADPAAALTGREVTFTDTSTDVEGPITARAWDLDDDGDHDDGTGATAARTFTSAGVFTVRLRVTDDLGLTATASRTVTVTAPAVNLLQNPSFETGLTGWSGFQATLTRDAVAGAPDGGWVARATRTTGTSFTIDDGNRSAVAVVAGRTYTASAWVRAATASSIGKPVTLRMRERTAGGTQVADVSSAPLPLTGGWQRLTMARVAAGSGGSIGMRVSQGSAAAGDAVQVDAASLTEGGGTPPPPPPPPPGNVAPTAAFTFAPASPLAGQTVTVTDTSTDPEGPIASRAWDLDDDGAYDDGTGATATRTFAAAGSYTVRLRVTDAAGAQAVATRVVTVGAAPPSGGNLLGNPSFETAVAPWAGFQATVTREAVTGAPDGAWVARVTRTTGTSFTVDDGNRQITSTVAGRTYTATAWVRAATAASAGRPVTLRLRERTPGGSQVADVPSAPLTLTTSWQRLQVTRTAAGAGNSLGVRVSHGSAVTGAVMQVDAVGVTSG